MAPQAPNKGGALNDFDPDKITDVVDQHGAHISEMKATLDELAGKKLDEKICKAIEDSVHIQDKISSLVWKTIREKIVWILLTLIALLVWDSLKTWLTGLIK